ncbi:hypothetical protein [Paramicrobacterium chengjingii]|uniref:hypothetical protein n=1 Tax=Paramicrobacterium chengjingii TaxID=2769067 RepID=UPI001AB0204B|nr:hypothetical protein [Microbacterium chengjingii]
MRNGSQLSPERSAPRAFAAGLFQWAKERVREEIGPELDGTDWRRLDPRRYDPRRIIREALLELIEAAEPTVTPAATTVESSSKSPISASSE